MNSPETFHPGFERSAERLIYAALGEAVTSDEARAVFAANGYTLMRISPEQLRDASLEREPPVAALIDLDLPGRAGWKLLESIASKAEEGPRFPFPVVAISASASERVIALRFGADDVLKSPFATTELVLRTRGALARSGRRIEALKGSLELYPLAALLQGCERRRWTGTVLLTTLFGRAGLGLYGGQIVQASAGRLDGREALFELLDLHEGQFVLDPAVIPVPRPPLVPAVWSLLLDSANLSLELEQREANLPEEGERLSHTGGTPALDDDLAPIPLEAVAERLRRSGPADLAELRAEIPASSRRLRLAAALLIEQGVVNRERSASAPATSPASEGASHDALLLYSPLVAPEIAALLAALPPHTLERPAGAPLLRFCLAGGVDGAGLRVQLRPLALHSVAEIFHDAARARRVVLWLGRDETAQGVPLRLLRAAARRAEDLVFAAEAREGHPLVEGRGELFPWRFAGCAAAEIASLLAAALQSPAGTAAAADGERPQA